MSVEVNRAGQAARLALQVNLTTGEGAPSRVGLVFPFPFSFWKEIH